MIAVPPPRPRPTPRPNYEYFQAVRSNVVEKVANYFGQLDGQSHNLSQKEALSASNYLRQWADYYQDDNYKSYVYNTYATVFDNLALALKQKDPAIDTGTFRPAASSVFNPSDRTTPDGQLFLGYSFDRSRSELRALAAQRGSQDVLSYQDFYYAKAPVQIRPFELDSRINSLALGEDA